MPTESTPIQPGWISDTTKTTPTITTDLESASHSLRSVFRDLKSITPEDANTLLQLFTSEIKGVQNDDTLLLERTVQLLSSQPETSGIGKSLTANFVNTLWDALPHPPLRSLGTQYRYREADGGNNNIRVPDLGRAGMPYAKSVKAERMKRRSLPDPGELFDGLMRRDENGEGDGKDGFKGSETGISSWLFYLATIIIHDLFLTDHDDMTKSKTSSYLDLAPLYGCNQEEQNAIKTFQDGKLKPDCFSSKRILGFPPGVGVFLIMFNRFHNYVVGMLAKINDNNRFTKPTPDSDKSAFDKYDNDLFQTGRLVTCGLYVNIVLKDYVRTILNLNRTTSKWDLDPRVEETKNLLNNPAAEGVGNQVSAEFNLIYRWHSAISQRDEKWTNEEYAKLFSNRNPSDVTLPELLRALCKMESDLPLDPSERSFANLTRQSNGSYDSEPLVSIFQSSVEDLSGAFGALNTPPIMRSVEILSILQSRQWNMCTLNEFRKFVGLTPHTSFADINPNPVIAKRLREFYGSPDDVEFYPGVVVEKTKPPMIPGSGLCTGYSISYSILSDAVGLVRGDRFYTTDFTPEGLTNWGYNEIQFDTNIDDGAVLYKLVLRAFPNHFEGNSIYAHFPFVTPDVNREIQKSLGREALYSWEVPKKKKELLRVDGWEECSSILEDSVNWKVTWGPAIALLTSHSSSASASEPIAIPPFCLAGDAPLNATSRSLITSCFYDTPNSQSQSNGHNHKSTKKDSPTASDWQSQITQFYTSNLDDLFQKHKVLVPSTISQNSKSKSISKTYTLDLADTSNRIFTRFAAGVFGIPLKLGMGNTVDVNITIDTDEGYTEEELYHTLSICFMCIFMNIDVTKSFAVNEKAKAVAKKLGEVLMDITKEGKIGEAVEGLKGKLHSLVCDDGVERDVERDVEREKEKLGLKGYGREMVEKFIEGGKKVGWGRERVVWEQILPTSAAMTANQSQLLVQVLDYYLSTAGEEYLPILYDLANERTADADDKLLRYFLEAARMHSTVALFRIYDPPHTATPSSTVTLDSSDHLPPSPQATSSPLPSQGSTTSNTSNTPKPKPEPTSTPTPGTTALLNLPLAHLDPSVFPDPGNVDVTRDLDKYLMFGWGRHVCIGRDVALRGLVVVFKEVMGRKGLRLCMQSADKGKGNGGVGMGGIGGTAEVGVRSMMTDLGTMYLDEEGGILGPFPGSLRVFWDEE